MESEFVKIENTDIRISSLAGWKKSEFINIYTGILMDVESAWKKVEKYTKRKPKVEESE